MVFATFFRNNIMPQPTESTDSRWSVIVTDGCAVVAAMLFVMLMGERLRVLEEYFDLNYPSRVIAYATNQYWMQITTAVVIYIVVYSLVLWSEKTTKRCRFIIRIVHYFVLIECVLYAFVMLLMTIPIGVPDLSFTGKHAMKTCSANSTGRLCDGRPQIL